jgi:hypothetical protein
VKDREVTFCIGEVYKGEWQSAPIALKKLKSSEEFEEFAKEASVLGYVKDI